MQRHTYRAWVRVFPGAPPSLIQYYYTPPGRPWFTEETTFWPQIQFRQWRDTLPIGHIHELPRTHKGQLYDPYGLPGDHFDGTLDDFAGRGVYQEVHPPTCDDIILAGTPHGGVVAGGLASSTTSARTGLVSGGYAPFEILKAGLACGARAWSTERVRGGIACGSRATTYERIPFGAVVSGHSSAVDVFNGGVALDAYAPQESFSLGLVVGCYASSIEDGPAGLVVGCYASAVEDGPAGLVVGCYASAVEEGPAGLVVGCYASAIEDGPAGLVVGCYASAVEDGPAGLVVGCYASAVEDGPAGLVVGCYASAVEDGPAGLVVGCYASAVEDGPAGLVVGCYASAVEDEPAGLVVGCYASAVEDEPAGLVVGCYASAATNTAAGVGVGVGAEVLESMPGGIVIHISYVDDWPRERVGVVVGDVGTAPEYADAGLAAGAYAIVEEEEDCQPCPGASATGRACRTYTFACEGFTGDLAYLNDTTITLEWSHELSGFSRGAVWLYTSPAGDFFEFTISKNWASEDYQARLNIFMGGVFTGYRATDPQYNWAHVPYDSSMPIVLTRADGYDGPITIDAVPGCDGCSAE